MILRRGLLPPPQCYQEQNDIYCGEKKGNCINFNIFGFVRSIFKDSHIPLILFLIDYEYHFSVRNVFRERKHNFHIYFAVLYIYKKQLSP